MIDAVFRKRQLLGVANFKAQAVGQPLLSRKIPSLAQQVGVEIDAHDLVRWSEALRRNPRDGPRTGSDIENGFARLRREKMKDGANHSHIARTSGTVFQHCDAAEIRAARRIMVK